ncbi:MAG: hypothetical protein DRP06_02575, partial [Candidatus Aenigmatarchaeota archaeon]
ASLKPVLESILEYKKHNIWIELTSLIIPGHNDSKRWIKHISSWIKTNLGEETPLHLSRFHPDYKFLDLEPTKIQVLKDLFREAKKNLKYVYIGNVSEPEYQSTFCSSCGNLIIKRNGSEVDFEHLKCRKCNALLEGTFD